MTLVGLFVSIATAMRRTFVFKEECANHRRECSRIQRKVEELHGKDLEMRDQTIKGLEEKIEAVRVELKDDIATTKTELREDICNIKGMLKAMLTKMNITTADVRNER